MPEPRAYYLPLPLRWYFLAAQILALSGTLGIVVALIYTMPDTDNSAVVDGRALARSVVLGIHPEFKFGLVDFAQFRRQANTAIVEPLAASNSLSSTAGSLPGNSLLVTNSRAPIRPTNSTNTPSTTATLIPSLITSASGGEALVVTTTSATEGEDSFLDPLLPGPGSNFFPGGTNAEPTFPDPTTTSADQNITIPDIWLTTYTPRVGHSSTVLPKTEPTVVTEPPSFASDPTFKSVLMIVSAIPTTMTITATVTPPLQVTTDSVGSTAFTTPVPVQTVETVTGVYSGQTLTTVRIDNGLTAETRTLTAVVNGSPVTVFVVSTPGQPITQTVVSVIGGITATVTPPPTTFVTVLGSVLPTTVTRTLVPYVTTVGGTTITITPPS